MIDKTQEKQRKKRAKFQVIKDKSGKVTGYRTQVIDPLNPKKRLELRAAKESELIHRKEETLRRRRDYKVGNLTDKDARAAIAQIERGGPMMIAECFKKYLASLKKRTFRTVRTCWEYRLKPFWGDKTVLDLTAENLSTWHKQQIEVDRVAATTAKSAWDSLRAAVNRQVDARKIAVPPWEGFAIRIDRKKMRREACRTIDEVRRLVMACRDIDLRRAGPEKKRYADLAFRVALAILCGLRQAEIGGLGWDDVDFRLAEPVLHVRNQCCDGWRREHPEWTRPMDPPKDGERDLVLHPNAIAVLMALRELQEEHGLYRPDGPVFPAHVKRGKDQESVWRGHADAIHPSDEMKKAWVAAGLPNVARVSPHVCRHSTGTLEAAASGGDLHKVSERLGHSSVSTSEVYIHGTERDLPKSSIPKFHLDLGVSSEKTIVIEDGGAPGGVRLLLPPKASSVADLCIVTPQYAREYAQKQRSRKAAGEVEEKPKKTYKVPSDFAGAFAEFVVGLDRARQIEKIKKALDEKSVQHHRGRKKEHIRPPQITLLAERARQRAKQEFTSGGSPPDVAKKAGLSAHRGVIANWSKYLHRRLRDLEGQEQRGHDIT